MTEGQTFAAAAIAGFAVGAGTFVLTWWIYRKPLLQRAGQVAVDQLADRLPSEVSVLREPIKTIGGPILSAILLEVVP